jgi:hypothetical protein
MQLDFNKPLLTLDRKPAKDQFSEEVVLNKLLAGQLANSNKGDATKLVFLAQKMFDGEVIDVDKSDVEVLKNFINNSEHLTNLMKAQMVEVIDDAKVAEKATSKLTKAAEPQASEA